jgi:hypothetical protein
MKVFKICLVLIAIGVLIIQSGCKKDPCLIENYFKADFTLGEIIGDSLIATDTLTFYRMTAHAAAKYDYMKWEIGSDPRNFENQQEVGLNFGTEYVGQTFTVRLIAKGKANTACFPDDDGIDTVTKKITRVCSIGSGEYSCLNQPSLKHLPAPFGVWRGSVSDNPTREFDVTLVDFGQYPPPGANSGYNSRLFNLTEGCGGPWMTNNLNGCGGGPAEPTSKGLEVATGALAFYAKNTEGTRCCMAFKTLFGRVNEKDRNQIAIYMTQFSTGQKTVFTGRRIK